MIIRLQKFLSQAQIASRRKSEELIKNNRIKINGRIVNELGVKVDPENDCVEYDGKLIKLNSDKIYIALNKPIGYISSTSDKQGKSVLNLIKTEQKLYPVGRLDKDSSGLLLLTNDGDFAYKITQSKFDCEKEYAVTLDKNIKKEDIHRIENGLIVGEKKLRAVKFSLVKNKFARIILRQGINRQIRKMFGKLGYVVIKLERIRIGNLELENLKPGHYKNIKPNNVI